MAGLFIAFEGGEGAGKTTQAGILHGRLNELAVSCELFREPGGTALGEYLRNYLKSHRPITPEAELLLFEAARMQLVTTEILPALKSGKTVIADRFSSSTVSYQGHGRGIDLNVIASLNGFATKGITPDVIFLLDVAPAVGLSRSIGGLQLPFEFDWAAGIASPQRKIDDRRFEDLDLFFHERVRQGFRAQADANPQQWVVIDAELSVGEVSGQIWENIKDRIKHGHRTAKITPAAPIPQAKFWQSSSDVPATIE